MASKSKSKSSSKSDENESKFKVIKRIGRIGRNGRTCLRIAVQKIDSIGVCIDLRVWYSKADDPELKPTAKGVCLHTNEVESVCRMLQKAAKVAAKAQSKKRKSK